MKTTPGPWGMNFSAMELYALIHDLEQQRMANQDAWTGKRWGQTTIPLHSNSELSCTLDPNISQIYHRQIGN
jgi:hypothetical protein